ncbi:polysaccharide biosynthesis/export family protein [Desulfovibrio sp. OttesenSCG-928-G15]|nr:polysaccharide biosynthesis/export family protein [Desulfovibrio sp. OttesenSCG-928-G15]
MHYTRLLPLVTIMLLLCSVPCFSAEKEEQEQDYSTTLKRPNGNSGVSASSPSSAGTPSGQGTGRMPSGMQDPYLNGREYSSSPDALYAPSRTLNAPRSFSGSPAWAQQAYPLDLGDFPPFGANLFQGYFAGTYFEGMNSDYTIMPGDRINVEIWGAHSYTDTLMVDQQGNIFLPEVGPVKVAGRKHGSLQGTVRSALSMAFTPDTKIYVNLLTAQPVAVYVTGFVSRPGRYAGGMSDSILYYLDRAGGILPDRGTYRNITVQRHNKTIAQMDLYAFLLHGALSGVSLRDGDVIVVGNKGGSISAGGLIPQKARFEVKGKSFSGAELIKYASPLPAVSHVSVTGTRNSSPFHVYMPLGEFKKFNLLAEDSVEFLADKPGESIMVTVSGSTLGSTRFPVKRNTTLSTLLAHVPIDTKLSNLSGIYLKRRSVVEHQKKAILDALRRLENSVLTNTSATEEGARIRVQEAELVKNFAKRVASVEPDGVVVVTTNGVTADIALEDGDEVVIPQVSDIVQVSGEVMIPKAVVFKEGQKLKDYIASAGGFTERADDGNVLVVHPNGEIKVYGKTQIMPGDMLLVMPRYDSKGFAIFKDIIQLLYQVAIATKVAVSI